MGMKPLNRVLCPRCKKIGTLRVKNRHSLIVSHYDPEKHRNKKGGGMKSHYIGSLRYNIDKILKPFDYEISVSPQDLMTFKDVLRRFSVNHQKNEKKPIMYEGDMSIFIALMNEIRKLKKSIDLARADNKLTNVPLDWSIRCRTCRQPYKMHATFRGVPRKERVMITSTRVPESVGTDAAFRGDNLKRD